MPSVNDNPGKLPAAWKNVVLSPDPANRFLLRPRQILVAPADVADVQKHLPDWKPDAENHTSGSTIFTLANGNGTAREVLSALATVRKATAGRPHGPAKVAPNHVFVGETGVTFTGEPRIQGGNATTARPEKPPATLPARTRRSDDGDGVKIAVLDTGLFDHAWLPPALVDRGANSDDTWDADGDKFGDAEAGHGTFVSGVIRQVAPAAHVHVVKVLDSQGVGDDHTVALAMERLPRDIQIVNLSLGGYTDDDSAPMAVAAALKIIRGRGGAIVAAAGNDGLKRPFWPAAFKQVLAVGAVHFGKRWLRAPWSNYGYWVDVAARGVNTASTYATAKTKFCETEGGPTTTLAFDGWARWDGTSFAAPITAAYLGRLMTRNGLPNAQDAVFHLHATSPAAPQPDFPLAVLVDELEGLPVP
jgi:Subtilase family